ncbi:tRNA (N6-threonylcarbamoyladenosine(37)-N6)-methyltransferase TrmO [Candidatus Aerophobetes bacterium]|nr:tRNA (N6-threonylcarbamoyladenosine(37)-N6)-methyltransferase TrmO [Candidatus Aerophobetes bacterium]
MGSARDTIQQMLTSGNLKGLVRKAGELHGHFCPYLSLGVRAGYIASKELNATSEGMEDVLAILETNNCFSDGVQMVTGCSFGNNALIYRDLGKTAFTLTKRDGEGIRMLVKADVNEILAERYPEYQKLFEKVIAQREGDAKEKGRMREMAEDICFDLLDIDEDVLFIVKKIKVKVPEYAPIFESVICFECKEAVMQSRTKRKNAKLQCLMCADTSYYQLDGEGIKQKRGQSKELFSVSPIGYVQNSFQDKADPEKMREALSIILVLPEYSEGLFKIEENEKIEVIFYFHKSEDFTLRQRTRAGNIRGVFACRSPKRPNSIGLATVDLIRREKNRLIVRGLDAINGTPVLDIKPHIQYVEEMQGEK